MCPYRMAFGVLAALGVACAAAADPVGGSPIGVPVHEALRAHLGDAPCTLLTLDPPRDPGEGCELVVPYNGHVQRLLLEPHSLRAPSFRLRVQDATGRLVDVDPPPVTTYRGHVADDPDSRVVASIVGGQIVAEVRALDDEDSAWAIMPFDRIVPGSPARTHLIYRVADFAVTEGHCATPDVPAGDDPPPEPLPVGGGATRSMDAIVCEIACDADVEFYELNNSSVDDTVADIEAVLNGVSTVYELDIQATFTITEIIVRTAEEDPYNTTDPQSLLDQFGDYWVLNHADIHRDVAHLFTGKDLAGSAIGIAWRGYLCNNLAFGLSQSRYTTEFARRVALTAHEIGHNFDAGHCDYGDWWCRIMCSSLGGCSGYHSFSPSAVDQMKNYAPGRPCIASGTVDPNRTQFPFFDDFEGSVDFDPNRWTAVDGAYHSQSGGYEPSPPWSAYFNEYDTARTRPMIVDVPATVSFWANPKGVEAGSGSYGKQLMVEYFNSTLQQWQILARIYSDGIDTLDFVYHEFAVPADGLGDYFALRFTPYGTFVDYYDKWYIDDVSIAPAPLPGDLNCDGWVNNGDIDAFVFALSYPEQYPDEYPDCDIMLGDINGDGSVNNGDIDGFVALTIR